MDINIDGIVPDTRTVNGHALSADVTVTATDIDALKRDGSNANSDVDLGNYALNAKSVKINGTAGNGHLGLKHQSTDATASASETVIFAGSDGEPRYKNDGGTVAQFASRAWVTAQGYITNVITALGFTPENVANKQSDLTASSTKYPTVDAVNTGLATKQAILTDANFGTFSNGLTAKTTPIDADTLNISDSADSNKSKKLSFTNLKSFLKTYFDTIYTTTSAVASQITTALSSYVPNARMVNGKSLSADVTLTPSDLGLFIYKSLTSSSTATGTSEVLLASINIGGSKFSSSDFLFIQSDFVRGTRTGSCQLRYYIGPNNGNLTGATQIALSTNANNTVGYMPEFSRFFKIKGGNIEGTLGTTASYIDIASSTQGQYTFDPTATVYLHITSTFTASGDTGFLNSVLIRNY